MLKALHYCHDVAKVFHRDIKPDNIMINHNNEAVLIDFGVSALKGDDDFIHTKMGTLLYFAPEMLQSGKNFRVQGAKTDIWALGITFYYLITGKYPYEAGNFYDLKRKVLEEEINFENVLNLSAKNFLKKVLIKDSNCRANLEDLISDPWITNNAQSPLNIQEVDYSREDNSNFGNI